MTQALKPHGGKLVSRILSGEERKEYKKRASGLKKITLDEREISDLEMIATGAYSPLEGFMTRSDYESVLSEKRLVSGLPWTIPITLAVSKEKAKRLKEGEEVALIDNSGRDLALFNLRDKYPINRQKESKEVFRTLDKRHPGVAYVYRREEKLLGGEVYLVERPQHTEFMKYRLDPADTRKIFEKRHWKTIVGFQTRNPIHRAHEYLQKCALEICDGLFINPIVGFTKKTDIPAHLRMKCYEVLLKRYYPHDRVVMGVLETAMRYAGPMEAIFHAIVRKNFGCTHFIVGRDHAGVGNYYGSFDAQHIFGEFGFQEIGITPILFDYAFYCKDCESMATTKTCPHPKSSHISLSGTKIREMLKRGEGLPRELTRPEVAKILLEWHISENS